MSSCHRNNKTTTFTAEDIKQEQVAVVEPVVSSLGGDDDERKPNTLRQADGDVARTVGQVKERYEAALDCDPARAAPPESVSA